jgi:hypothetical protein
MWGETGRDLARSASEIEHWRCPEPKQRHKRGRGYWPPSNEPRRKGVDRADELRRIGSIPFRVDVSGHPRRRERACLVFAKNATSSYLNELV